MASEVFDKIVKAIEAGEPELLEFANLAPEDSALILESLLDPRNGLDERAHRIHFSAPDRHLRMIQPSKLRAAAVSWLYEQHTLWVRDRLNDKVALKAMDLLPSPPGITEFTGTYAGSVKEPDFTFFPHKPKGLLEDFPSVVLEFGWTSSEPETVDYRRLWHEGSGGQVRVVIFVKLCRPNAQNQICATLEISHCTPETGTVATTTQIEVFPVPNPIPADPAITMDELFSGYSPSGLNPETELILNVGDLRRVLKTNIIKRGYLPA
ncbi:hypothetical protein B9Z19DRAFT_1127966 [Tuber borchii]|uniref:Uncharacterized protein n=1 Tax=Tuber borchii TaxID=42251 RepID=A0A2T6ZQF3_TUBBO|nr:hypothetical protein B9Z19DRAFT_1127966 [Tuber borchii]